MGTVAASHGGKGENNGGGVYDYAYAPRMPGQQNREATVEAQSRGGGLVRVHAGSMLVKGTIEADGLECSGGCASGGAIWLTSRGTLKVTQDAVLSAKGATSTIHSSYGSGGGGRVAFAERATDGQVAALLSRPNVIPSGLEDVTEEKLAALPNLADAAAPGDTARDISECWGTVYWLRNPTIVTWPMILFVQ